MHKWSLSNIRSRTGILLLLLLIGGSVITGVIANRVVVQPVQPLAGNEATVPAPELQVLNSIWRLDRNTSTVTGVLLNVTTVSTSAGTPVTVKLYRIIVQVSATTPAGRVYTASTGTAIILLPSNMNGATAIVLVNLTPPVDPEIVEIDDLSFIVTAIPVTPRVTGIPNPSTVSINPTTGTASFSVPVQSVNGFTGTVSLSTTASPGLMVSLSTNTVSLTAASDGVTVNGMINVTAPIDPGIYYATIMLSPTTPGAPLFPIVYNIAIIVPFYIPYVSIKSNPTFLAMLLYSGTEVQTVTNTVTSEYGFIGWANVTATITPLSTGLTLPTVTPSSEPLYLGSAGESLPFTETVNATLASVGFYLLTNTATYYSFGTIQHVSATVTIEVYIIT